MTPLLRIVASRRYGTLSPLRYPGGKASLAGLFEDVLSVVPVTDVTYVEPYAGGAGAGVALLRQGLVNRLVINDFDPAVHAFWVSVTEDSAQFVDRVLETPLTIGEWQRQRAVYRAADTSDRLALGFAFFYLNRTNRSGILNAGVIGGQKQQGAYKIDARFNRQALAERLLKIGELAERITVLDLDGRSVIRRYGADPNAFIYIDPPYVEAGSCLYLNAFERRDHEALATIVGEVDRAHWLMTYDHVQLIERLYADHFQCTLELSYSARHPGKAEELLVASPEVALAIREILTSRDDTGAASA